MRPVPRAAVLALAVGLVLADSSVVTLGLPDVLGEFDAAPRPVSWVLTSYNLALAVAALPAAALVARRRCGVEARANDAAAPHAGQDPSASAPAGAAGAPSRPAALAAAGIGVFAAASLACALAPSLGVLIAARAVQGIGGAVVACAALVLLEATTGSRARGAALWGAAGAIGAAVGPAAGGLLTETLHWRSIFAAQVPLALVCLAALRGTPRALPEPPGTRRPDVRHLLALGFLGAGLTAALFLLVLLLIAGWRISPIGAALTVSVMPAAALLAARTHGGDARTRGGAGAVLVAGGLAALGLLPDASIWLTLVPQAFTGFGLGLALGPITEAALAGRSPLVVHGGWTITARHAGVVAALALLTPLFADDLERQEAHATESVLASILDSELAPETKLEVSVRLAGLLDAARGEVPAIAPAFDAVPVAPSQRAAVEALRADVDEQLDRAATAAFERSFLVAAALALCALVPLLVPVPRPAAGAHAAPARPDAGAAAPPGAGRGEARP
jgi:MFS family permease